MALTDEYEYQIVVPSRRRTHCIGHMLSLVPQATIVIHESERDEYLAVVPEHKLVTHNVVGVPEIRNWMLENFQAPVQVQMDDDLQYVQTQIGRKKRRLTNPDDIERILENQIICMTELKLGIACFSRIQNTSMVQPDSIPFRMVCPISCTIIFGGPARHRHFEPECRGRADADFTMRTLQDDRILLADMRYVFEHGPIFSGKGGNVGLLTKADFDKSTENLKKRWGQYLVTEKKPKFKEKNVSQAAMSIKVNRKSALAVRK